MAIQYGEVLYALRDLRAARFFTATATYDTASSTIDYAAECSFDYMVDNDALPAFGMNAEGLSVVTHAEGMVRNGSATRDAMFIVAGTTSVSSGTLPNRTATYEIQSGGSGLPYFGMVGRYAALDGSCVLVGFRKAKLDAPPGWKVEQNKFRIAEMKFKSFPVDPTATVIKLVRVRFYETDTAIPVDLNSFFTP